MGDNYIAWKALATGETDVVKAVPESGVNTSILKFKVEGLSEIVITPTQDLQVSVRGQSQGTVEELLAYEAASDTVSNPLILAKLNLASYSKLNRQLVMVKVNDAPNVPDDATAKTELNKIYSQAVVNWTSVRTESLTITSVNTQSLDDGGSGILSSYTGDMRSVINAYFKNAQPAADTYYIFFVHRAKDASKLGFMPRRRQAGFVFTAAHSTIADVVHTMAHELGHGAFRLEHTFTEHASLPKGATDNLMDYGTGTRLNKYQWDNIHDPVQVLGLFEGDEEGAMVRGMTEEQFASWWEHLLPYQRAAEILKEHFEDTDVYENIRMVCDNAKCTILSDLKIGTDITYTMEVTFNASMTSQDLTDVLVTQYHIDLWEAFNVSAETFWERAYNWLRAEGDNLSARKGWSVGVANFLADAITAPTLYPAVHGWATGKHWRDGHDLAGWEQALAALDFLVAEELVKGCITNFVVRVGTKTVNLLRLKEGTRYLVQKSVEKGLKFSVLANDEVIILTQSGKVVGRIVGDVLTIPYTKYGGDIVCVADKTTTVIGKWEDVIDGGGTSEFINAGLSKSGSNVGGINILSENIPSGWTNQQIWDNVNEPWLRAASNRGDVIRVVSSPLQSTNTFKLLDGIPVNVFSSSESLMNYFKNIPADKISQLSFFGRELKWLADNGYVFDSINFVLVKR